MYQTKVLILTTDLLLEEQLRKLLSNSSDNYTIFHRSELGEQPDLPFDITLIDENLIDKKPTVFLAQYTFELFPSSVIYLTSSLETAEDFTAVKSLTTDYLIKDQLTASGLHNCIKYAMESRSLKLEIEKQQKRYQSLFYNAVDAAFFLTPDWKIENINQVFTDLFGVKRGQINHLDFGLLFYDEEDFLNLKNKFDQENSTFCDVELKFKRIDRKGLFQGHLKISVLRETNYDAEIPKQEITGYHGTLNNVSYKKRLETIKENSSKIAMTYRLARTLAHEIRNPLTNITLAVNQLEDEIPKNEESQLYIGIIERCTIRIDKLIDQLLKSSEQKSLESSSCDIVSIVNEAIEGARDRAKLLNIELEIDFEDGQLPYFCDAGKLKIAVSNIITNAIESIEKDTGKVIIGSYKEDGYLCVYIEDNGVGMTEAQKKTLFDPFSTSKKKGVGLGLTDTLATISEHNGQIEVESEQGLGSTFTILLPVNTLESETMV